MNARELMTLVDGILDSVIKLQPKNGHWTRCGKYGYRCSRCGAFSDNNTEYCPNCGHKLGWRVAASEERDE